MKYISGFLDYPSYVRYFTKTLNPFQAEFIEISYNPPKLGLVIPDGASSRLDPATERLLEHAIDHLLKDRTAVIISHRLTTLDRADLVMLLEAGSVAEFGNRDTLLADPDSKFSELLKNGFEEMLVLMGCGLIPGRLLKAFFNLLDGSGGMSLGFIIKVKHISNTKASDYRDNIYITFLLYL